MDLSDPILSRFDVLCVVKDEADPMMDQHLAKFVVNSHIRHHPSKAENEEENDNQEEEIGIKPISQDLLKKYIVYARQNKHPTLTNIDQDKISKFYSQLRSESQVRFVYKIYKLKKKKIRKANDNF